MQMLFKSSGGALTVYLSGDIDHYTSKPIREGIDAEIARTMPKELRLDFSSVNFMDSSGIGLVMGRYKTACVYGCSVTVSAMSPCAARIMKFSGLDKIITFEKS